MAAAETPQDNNSSAFPRADAGKSGGASYPPEFLSAVDRVLRDEGVHADVQGDPGGDTWFGISRAEYPDIAWPPSREAAIGIYFNDWWLKFRYAEVRPELGPKVFDLAVNIGPKGAAQCLQRAVRACGVALEDDGVLGPQTRAAVNSYSNPTALLAAVRSEAAGCYRTLVTRQPALVKFLPDWLSRAYR